MNALRQPLEGKSLGPYELMEELGRGGQRDVGLVEPGAEEEGLLAGPRSLQPLQCHVGQLIGDVALLRHRLTIDVERPLAPLRRVVVTLAAERDPLVETRPRRIGVPAHVPLAKVASLVAGRLQVLREELRALRREDVVVDHAVVVHVLAGQDGGAAR